MNSATMTIAKAAAVPARSPFETAMISPLSRSNRPCSPYGFFTSSKMLQAPARTYTIPIAPSIKPRPRHAHEHQPSQHEVHTHQRTRQANQQTHVHGIPKQKIRIKDFAERVHLS